jgi:hypothetical protein
VPRKARPTNFFASVWRQAAELLLAVQSMTLVGEERTLAVIPSTHFV